TFAAAEAAPEAVEPEAPVPTEAEIGAEAEAVEAGVTADAEAPVTAAADPETEAEAEEDPLVIDDLSAMLARIRGSVRAGSVEISTVEEASVTLDLGAAPGVLPPEPPQPAAPAPAPRLVRARV